jgi:hypothetical protein
MHSAFTLLRGATRQSVFGSKPVWQPHARTSSEELCRISEALGRSLPDQLAAFLLEFGFGDITNELSFRLDWLSRIKDGPLTGHIIFGQDDRGNFYTVEPQTDAIHYLSRSGAGHCQLAASFTEFLQASQECGYKVATWAESLELLPNDSAA